MKIAPCSHHQFKISRLTIVPDLVGARHDFLHQGKRVVINLPALAQVIEGRRMTDAIESGWHWVGEEDKPQNFHVYVVHVRVRGQEMEVPDEVLRSPNTRWQAFDENKQQSLVSLMDALSVTANDAYAAWLRVMRWKSGIGFIGEPYLLSRSLARKPRLECCATGRHFWTADQVLTVPREETVSSQQWEEAQSALSSGDQPPIFLDFLFDGEHRARNSDFVGATLSLAIAFESAVRSLITAPLPNEGDRWCSTSSTVLTSAQS